MATYQSEAISLDHITTADGRNNEAAPYIWVAEYDLNAAVRNTNVKTERNDGSRAVGDIDEIIILRPNHSISSIILYSPKGISATDFNLTVGLLDGKIGEDHDSTAAAGADTNRSTIGSGVDLNATDLTAEFSASASDGETFFNVDYVRARAVGIRWGSARAAAYNSAGVAQSNATKNIIHVGVQIALPNIVRC